jgi:DNA-binding transcriptional LysR family regulator
MKLSSIDLNLLLVLHLVLSERSVAGAARKLHLTPPAVSNALARLRASLADPLFVRRGRGLVPTPRALELAAPLAAAFGGLGQALEENVAFDPASTQRRFVLACSDADQICSVPTVARAFARAMPRAQLQVVSIDQLTASDGLAAGTVDAAISPPTRQPGLHGQDLYRDEAVLVVRRGHPQVGARLSRAGFNTLRHVDIWLVLGQAGIGNRMAEAFFQQHGLVRQVALIVPTFSAAAMVAAATDLAAGMPRRVAERLARTLPLRLVRLPAPPMPLQLQLIWHERTHRDPGAIHFRALVTRAIGGPPDA